MKKVSFIVSMLILLSLLLGACAPAAAPEVEAPVVEATAVAATEVPVVAPDVQVLWTELIATIPADQGYGTVSAANLNTELAEKAPFILDVREAAELEKDGFIEGAINIPVRDTMKNLDKLPGLDEPIVVYCASGHRGAFVMSALKLMGYTDVRNLAGGLNGWKKAEFPVVTGSTPAAPVAGTAPIIEDQALFTMLDEFFTNLPEGFGSVSAANLNTELTEKAPYLLDVRTADEFGKNGRIEGAVNNPLSDVFSNLEVLPKDQPIVVYCVSGHRAAVVTMGLQLLGYDARNLGGGFNGWKAAELPIVGFVDWNQVWGDFIGTLPEGYYAVSASNLNAELSEKTPVIVDIREVSEYETDHIAGSINLPIRTLLQNLDKLPAQDQAIVIYCASGHRGAFAMSALRLLGYTDVRNIGGGLNAWKKAEFPVSTEVTEPVAGTAPVVDETRFVALDTFLAGLPDSFYATKAVDLNLALAEADKPVIIDVRSASEVAETGYIEGSVNIPVLEFWTRLSEIPQDKAAKIVITCASGHRGAIAAMALRMNGYTEVTNLAGGVGGWIAADLPVVK